MDNRHKLLSIVDEYKDVILKNQDYVTLTQLLKKIRMSMFSTASQTVKIDFNDLCNLTDAEMSLFTSPDCSRIIASFCALKDKLGWKEETVLKLIKRLEEDIVVNRMTKYQKELDSLDRLYQIIEEELYSDNLDLILEFIKECTKKEKLTKTEAYNLNFYILKQCLNYNKSKNNQEDIINVEINSSQVSTEVIRKQLKDLFSKYGYVYDEKKFVSSDMDLDKFLDMEYLEYILSKFSEYDIDNEKLYIRKNALYNIVIDKDRESFDAILKFIDKNKCSLYVLLGIPSIFSSYQKNYSLDDDEYIEIVGSNKDFFANIKIYSRINNKLSYNDEDIIKLYKYLSTPNSLIQKNLNLLYSYLIIERGTMPKNLSILSSPFVEYNIDRIIELGLFRDCLSMACKDGKEYIESSKNYCLEWDESQFKFFKLKRAVDFKEPLFAKNGKFRKVFTDDTQSYKGIKLIDDDNGELVIDQESLSQEEMDKVPSDVRKKIPHFVRHSIEHKYSDKSPSIMEFEQVHLYNVFSPKNFFPENSLKAERMEQLFDSAEDITLTAADIKELSNDYFINILDHAVHNLAYDSDFDIGFDPYLPLKYSDLEYIFTNPYFPNSFYVISRYKVLKLCKLLKKNKCWINKNSSEEEITSTLLAVLTKDSIITELDLTMIFLSLNEILTVAKERKSKR